MQEHFQYREDVVKAIIEQRPDIDTYHEYPEFIHMHTDNGSGLILSLAFNFNTPGAWEWQWQDDDGGYLDDGDFSVTDPGEVAAAAIAVYGARSVVTTGAGE